MGTLRPLTPELARIAAEDYNEIPEQIESELGELKEWIKDTPHLNARTDDQFLVSYLRGCKHNLEKTKEKIDTFYMIKNTLPDILTNRDPIENKKILEILNLGTALPLKPIREFGPIVSIFRAGAYNPKVYNLMEVSKVSCMIHDILLNDNDNYVFFGDMAIVDCKGMNKDHLLNLNFSLAKKIDAFNVEAASMRPRQYHYINTPSFMHVIFNIYRKFITIKNDELFFHPTMESLYEHIPKEILPEEYGGDAGPISDITKRWEEKFLEYREYFVEDDKFERIESEVLKENKSFFQKMTGFMEGWY